MSYLFNTIKTSLAAGRLLIIEPLIRSLIDEKGWQSSGIFQIYQPTSNSSRQRKKYRWAA